MHDLDFSLEEIPVAVVGPKTAEATRTLLGIEVSLIAEEYTAEGLALATALQAAGASVTVVEAYRTELGRGGDDVASMLAAGAIEAITFTSPSTAQNFMRRLAEENSQANLIDTICLAAIGPVTAKAMRKLGLQVNVMPEKYTLPELVEALEIYFDRKVL